MDFATADVPASHDEAAAAFEQVLRSVNHATVARKRPPALRLDDRYWIACSPDRKSPWDSDPPLYPGNELPKRNLEAFRYARYYTISCLDIIRSDVHEIYAGQQASSCVRIYRDELPHKPHHRQAAGGLNAIAVVYQRSFSRAHCACEILSLIPRSRLQAAMERDETTQALFAIKSAAQDRGSLFKLVQSSLSKNLQIPSGDARIRRGAVWGARLLAKEATFVLDSRMPSGFTLPLKRVGDHLGGLAALRLEVDQVSGLQLDGQLANVLTGALRDPDLQVRAATALMFAETYDYENAAQIAAVLAPLFPTSPVRVLHALGYLGDRPPQQVVALRQAILDELQRDTPRSVIFANREESLPLLFYWTGRIGGFDALAAWIEQAHAMRRRGQYVPSELSAAKLVGYFETAYRERLVNILLRTASLPGSDETESTRKELSRSRDEDAMVALARLTPKLDEKTARIVLEGLVAVLAEDGKRSWIAGRELKNLGGHAKPILPKLRSIRGTTRNSWQINDIIETVGR